MAPVNAAQRSWKTRAGERQLELSVERSRCVSVDLKFPQNTVRAVGQEGRAEDAHSGRLREEESEEGVSFGKSGTRRKGRSPSQLKSDTALTVWICVEGPCKS